MGHMRRTRLFPVALSIPAAAESMKLPLRVIREAVYKYATLEAYIVEGRVRIPVVALVEWIKTYPRATLARATRGRRT
jgi:hypothetical protein